MQRFDACIEAVVPATTWVDRCAEAAGLDDDLRNTLQVCVEELASNSIRHGLRPHKGWFALKLATTPQVAVLEFSDDAHEFDITEARAGSADRPLAQLEPGGLGIGLVRSLSSRCRYQRLSDGVNLVTLEFARTN